MARKRSTRRPSSSASKSLAQPRAATITNAGENKVRVPSAAPRTEKGYTNASTIQQFWTDLAGEETPEVRWPLSVWVYDRMTRTETQVTSVLALITSPILRATWAIDGSGCDPDVVAHVAGDLSLPVLAEPDMSLEEPERTADRFARSTPVTATRTRGRFSFSEHLGIAVEDHLVFGHAVFEQTYWPIVPVEDGGDGLFHLRKLGYRPPKTIAAFNVAADGGLISIQQKKPEYVSGALVGYRGLADDPIPVNRLVVYVHKRKGGNWQGVSVLRSCYKNVLLKDRELRIGDLTLERNGMGIPFWEAADGSEAQVEAGQKIATAIRAGEDAGAAGPKGSTLKLLGVEGDLPDALPWIRYHDESIAKAVLANVLNLGQTGGTGSWALGQTLESVKNLAVEVVAENIRDTASKHIVEDLVDINYGPTEPAPRLVFAPIVTTPATYGGTSVASPSIPPSADQAAQEA